MRLLTWAKRLLLYLDDIAAAESPLALAAEVD